MLRTTTVLALVIALPMVCAAAGPARGLRKPPPPVVASSPLDMEPAVVDYVSNDAPFVVFDIAPRTLKGGFGPDASRKAELTFVATEPLAKVDVFSNATAPRTGDGPPLRTACGQREPGHHSCTIALQEALVHLNGNAGHFALRIEAEGLDGERSTVRITLPVAGGIVKPAAPPGNPSNMLMLLSAP